MNTLQKTTLFLVMMLGLVTFILLPTAATAGDEAAQAQPAMSAQAANMAMFAKGAKLWADNCNRCHNLRSPKELRDDQWRAVVFHMRVRGGLTKDDMDAIVKFLQESN